MTETASSTYQRITNNEERSDDPRQHAFGGLTAFQVDLLLVASRGPYSGQEIKDVLDSRYSEAINNGRLYPNLDVLGYRNLVEKRQRDRRTNEYAITELGGDVLPNVTTGYPLGVTPDE